MSWVRVFLKFILIIQLSFPCALFAEPRSNINAISPDPQSIIDIPNEFFEQSPLTSRLPQLTDEYEEMIKEQVKITSQQSVQTFQEVLFLLHLLHKRVEEQVAKEGLDSVIRQVSAKNDISSIEKEYPGIGKAELKAIGNDPKDLRLITTVRHNSGHYFIFVDRSQFDPDFLETAELPENNPKAREAEIELRKNLQGVIRKIAATMLMNGAGEHQYNTITTEPESEPEKLTAKEEEIRKAVEVELSPMSRRYNEVVKGLANSDLSPSVRKMLESERDILENEFIKKSNDKSNILSRIIQTEVSNLGDYKVNGYQVTIITHNFGNTITKVKHLTRPSITSLQYWREYGYAIWEKPHMRTDLLKEKSFFKKMQFFTKGDPALAIASTSIQVVLSVGAASFTTAGPDPTLLAINSVIWGLGVGIFVRTFNNWVQRVGNRFTRTLKNAFTGTGFGYTQFALEGSMTLEGNAQLWATQSLKGFIKAGAQEIPRFEGRTGAGLKNVTFFSKTKKFLYETEIRWETLLGQMVQWVLFVPKLASIFLPNGAGIPFYMAFGPLGKMLHVMQVERYADMIEAQKGPDSIIAQKYRKEAIALREEWEDVKLIHRLRLLSFVDDMGRRVEHMADLIEQQNPDTRMTRFRIRVHMVIAQGIRKTFNPVIERTDQILANLPLTDFLVSRALGFYLVPAFRKLSQWNTEITWQKIPDYYDSLEEKIKIAGARIAYRTYVYANSFKNRPPTRDPKSGVIYCRAIR